MGMTRRNLLSSGAIGAVAYSLGISTERLTDSTGEQELPELPSGIPLMRVVGEQGQRVDNRLSELIEIDGSESSLYLSNNNQAIAPQIKIVPKKSDEFDVTFQTVFTYVPKYVDGREVTNDEVFEAAKNFKNNTNHHLFESVLTDNGNYGTHNQDYSNGRSKTMDARLNLNSEDPYVLLGLSLVQKSKV